MTISALNRRGFTATGIARSLSVTEGTVRYHLRRQAAEAIDGRSKQKHIALEHAEAIDSWVSSLGQDAALNLASLHEYLVREHGYAASLRSLQRYFKAHYPAPARRARRRVETPPGGQTQVDWGHFPSTIVAGYAVDLYAFVAVLSHCRHGATVFARRKHQLSWQRVHNEAFRRLGGISATVRVDNEKTAIGVGAGSWGEINPAYRSYARTVGFHVDACQPREPQAKGKAERWIRTLRGRLGERDWVSLEELQAAADEESLASAKRRTCPATGTSVFDAWQAERRLLQPLPHLPEPFDVAVQRRVSIDCLVSFEGRSYSVPFRYVDEMVEVRGCAEVVQIVTDGGVVQEHPRGTDELIVIDPACYEGDSTERVQAPPPLGKMGRRLQEIWQAPPEARPIDLYATLAEVAR